MLKRSIAIAAMLVPGSMAGCGEGPAVVGPASEGTQPAVSATALSGPPAAPSPSCVPFRANGSAGTVEIAGGPPPSPLQLTVSAEGQATHLGRYASWATGVITFASPPTAVFDGYGTFTAANGDRLDFEYSGEFFPGAVPGGLGSYAIVGGTGRFDGATGSGIFDSRGGDTTFRGELCFAR